MFKNRTVLKHTLTLGVLFALLLALAQMPPAQAAEATALPPFPKAYGVFLSCDPSQMARFAPCQTVVIDAQYFTAADIATLKNAGHTVLTYLNIGSLENFRPYYDQFVARTLAPYENWEEERWMDVTDPAWQTFTTDTLAAEALSKGVDGFFIDNCDVYYLYPTDAVFDALTAMLGKLVAMGEQVVINGGDTFVSEVADRMGAISGIMTGVNQESVFSAIDFDKGVFSQATEEDHAYFMNYVERVAALGGKVYLLEYTTDTALIAGIEQYCTQRGFTWYVSDSIELD